MKTHIVKIGNSQGVRIPKPLIEQTGLEGEVEIGIKGNTLVISKPRKPRAGWTEAFAQMNRNGDDALLDANRASSSAWDEEEWEWK